MWHIHSNVVSYRKLENKLFAEPRLAGRFELFPATYINLNISQRGATQHGYLKACGSTGPFKSPPLSSSSLGNGSPISGVNVKPETDGVASLFVYKRANAGEFRI